MKVAVIIVHYNDTEDTIRYVNTIKEYEIIDRIVVVDNLSTTKGAFQMLKSLESEKVYVIQSPKNGGYNYGNNFGMRYLQEKQETYDYFIISNPDIEVTQKAIQHCLEVLESHEEIALIAPRMFHEDGTPIRRSSWKMRTFWLDVIHSTRILELLFYKVFKNGEYTQKDYEQELLEVEAISGAFFIIKDTVLKQIGMFDENVFLFYEEDILAKKLKAKSYKTISLNSEKCIHYESQTIGKTFSYYHKMKELYKSKLYYHKTYGQIHFMQILLFAILNLFRKIELLIEIPIRKILNK